VEAWVGDVSNMADKCWHLRFTYPLESPFSSHRCGRPCWKKQAVFTQKQMMNQS